VPELINIYLWLFFAHLVTDFPLQGDFLANMKARSIFILLVHSGIWTGGICYVLVYFGLFSYWKLIFLLVGHAVADRLKDRYSPEEKKLTASLYIDQLWHAFQLLAVMF